MKTKQELLERLQHLWAIASSSCGSATSQLMEEIRAIEDQLARLKETA